MVPDDSYVTFSCFLSTHFASQSQPYLVTVQQQLILSLDVPLTQGLFG